MSQLLGVELICDDLDGFTVIVRKAVFPVSYDQVRFSNSECYAVDYDDDYFKISASFDSCNTTTMVSLGFRMNIWLDRFCMSEQASTFPFTF